MASIDLHRSRLAEAVAPDVRVEPLGAVEQRDVEFRLKAYSRSATSRPLWLRLGFRLVGRRQQVAFYRNV